jgi:glycosyltransferase involved in cell wall biosynthesis
VSCHDPRAVATPEQRDARLRVLNLARDAGFGGIGGAEILVLEFARRLDPARFKSYMCTTRAPEPDRQALAAQEAAELEAAGITVLTLNRHSSWSLAPWARLYALMRRERIDVVHAHMPRASIPGSLLARLAGVPVIISHEHGSILYGHPIRKLLDRNVVGRCSDVVLAVSDWDRRKIIELEGIPAERVRVFRNGILAFPEAKRGVRAELELPGAALIGAVGRLDPVKGYDDLIRAVGLLKSNGRAIRCVIAGVGPDEERLRRLIGELDLAHEVRLLGLRNDVPDVLRALDVAVLPSHSEGAPLAVIEYMAAGTPIVATKVGGVPELIEDGVHGLLVAPRDPPRLAAAIGRLLDDGTLARGLADGAWNRQQAELDLAVTVQRLETLYLELFANSRRHSKRRQVGERG